MILAGINQRNAACVFQLVYRYFKMLLASGDLPSAAGQRHWRRGISVLMNPEYMISLNSHDF